MATLTAVNPSWNRSMTGRFMVATYCLSDGSATWKSGEFLRIGADGLLYEGTTSAASGVAADAITHYALSDLDTATTGVDTNYRKVGIVHEDDVFEINDKSTTVAGAKIGQWYGMDVTSNVCTIDTTNTTHKVFQVLQPTWREREIQDSSADTKARAMVQVLARTINAARV